MTEDKPYIIKSLTSNNPFEVNLICEFYEDSDPFQEDVYNLIKNSIDNHIKTKFWNSQKNKYYEEIRKNNPLYKSPDPENFFNFYNLIRGSFYTNIPTLRYRELLKYDMNYLNDKFNQNETNNLNIKKNIKWNILYKNLAIIQTDYNMKIIKFTLNKQYNLNLLYNISTTKKLRPKRKNIFNYKLYFFIYF